MINSVLKLIKQVVSPRYVSQPCGYSTTYNAGLCPERAYTYIKLSLFSRVSRSPTGHVVCDGDGVATEMNKALSLALYRELAHEVTDECVATEGADV